MVSRRTEPGSEFFGGSLGKPDPEGAEVSRLEQAMRSRYFRDAIELDSRPISNPPEGATERTEDLRIIRLLTSVAEFLGREGGLPAEIIKALGSAIDPLPDLASFGASVGRNSMLLRRYATLDKAVHEASLSDVFGLRGGAERMEVLGYESAGLPTSTMPDRAPAATDIRSVDDLLARLPRAIQVPFVQVDNRPLRLIERMHRAPEDLFQLTGLQFEEFIASVLVELGFTDVVVTPPSNDKGRDIIATTRVAGVPMYYAFECKKYSRLNPVGPSVVRGLLGTVKGEGSGVNKGVLVTTSRFTKGATQVIVSNAPLLDGRDFNGVVDWLGQAVHRRRRGHS